MDQDSKLDRALTFEERLALLGVEAIWDGGDHFTFRPLLLDGERGDLDSAERAPLPGGRRRP
jgi:hypothetical protein